MTFWYLLAGAIPLTLIAATAIYTLFRGRSPSNGMELALGGLAVVSLTGGLIFGVGFLAANVDRDKCIEYGERNGLTVRYDLFSGCHIIIDGRSMPYNPWADTSGASTH